MNRGAERGEECGAVWRQQARDGRRSRGGGEGSRRTSNYPLPERRDISITKFRSWVRYLNIKFHLEATLKISFKAGYK